MSASEKHAKNGKGNKKILMLARSQDSHWSAFNLKSTHFDLSFNPCVVVVLFTTFFRHLYKVAVAKLLRNMALIHTQSTGRDSVLALFPADRENV